MTRDNGLTKLPGMAFAKLAVTGAIIAITLGESHYERVTPPRPRRAQPAVWVTPAQARAMLAGVLVGWRTHLANPELYGPYGELLEEPVTGSAHSYSHGLS